MAKSKIIASVLFSVLFMLPSVMVEAAGPKLKLTRKSTEAKAKAAPQEPAVLKHRLPRRFKNKGRFLLIRVSSTITTVLLRVAEFLL